MARSVAYVRLIPPGAADTVHYRLRIPEDCGDTIRLRAKVNYRKFSWWNTQWAFAGVRDPSDPSPSVTASHDDGKWVFTGDTSGVSGGMKKIPSIPTTIMSSAEATLKVAARGAALPADAPFLDKSVRERWNDYGIGLLLQGDLKGAEAAFEKVTVMEPGYADGWVNVGRARIQEGNMEGAEEVLRKALALDPELAKTHFFLAIAVKARGRYDEALEHLRAAAEQYPRDRVVRNQIGRVLFLKRAVQGGDRGAPEGPRDRPRGPAGPLQPHALLAGPGRRREGRASPGPLQALQGRRERAGHHRPLPPAPSRRQQRAPVHPRAPHGGAGPAAGAARVQRSGR